MWLCNKIFLNFISQNVKYLWMYRSAERANLPLLPPPSTLILVATVRCWRKSNEWHLRGKILQFDPGRRELNQEQEDEEMKAPCVRLRYMRATNRNMYPTQHVSINVKSAWNLQRVNIKKNYKRICGCTIKNCKIISASIKSRYCSNYDQVWPCKWVLHFIPFYKRKMTR